MSDTIANIGPSTDSTYGQGKGRKQPADEKATLDGEHHEAADNPDLRLIIEDGPDGEAPVYKTVDHRTGAVVQSLPSEEVLHLGEAKTYIAGQLIKASV